jgi:magnesium transporter
MSTHRRSHRRLKPRIRRRTAPGTRPGTLSVAADALETKIDVIAYNHERVLEQSVRDPEELAKIIREWPVVWVNVVGLGTQQTLQAIAELFHIHPLAMEVVVNVHQRAKIEPYEDNVYCVLRMPRPTSDELTEQLSLLIGKDYVVTFQEGPGDCFQAVRERLQHEHGMRRQETRADYLAYRLIDTAVDAYFPVLEAVGDHLDELDDRAATSQGTPAFGELHGLKRELLMLRRAIWPIRDALSVLRAEATPLVTDQTRVYLRDCYDHAVQLIDLLESYRDICSDLRDFYVSAISIRMNEVMKTLTVIATIFMPLSFIASLYGMNFDTSSPWNMPELHWRWGYPLVLGVMATVAGIMLLVFKRRGWLTPTRSEEEGVGPLSRREKGLVHPHPSPLSATADLRPEGEGTKAPSP